MLTRGISLRRAARRAVASTTSSASSLRSGLHGSAASGSILKNYNQGPEARTPFASKSRPALEDGSGRPAGGAAPGAPRDPLKETTSVTELLRTLAEKRAVDEESVKAVGETREWKDYEAEVNFELNLVRWRYSMSGEKMTPARRQQMAAHAAQTQMKVMEEHADIAAKRHVASLTAKERNSLREMFLRLEARGVDLKPKPLDPTTATASTADSLASFQRTVAETLRQSGQMSEEAFRKFEARMAELDRVNAAAADTGSAAGDEAVEDEKVRLIRELRAERAAQGSKMGDAGEGKRGGGGGDGAGPEEGVEDGRVEEMMNQLERDGSTKTKPGARGDDADGSGVGAAMTAKTAAGTSPRDALSKALEMWETGEALKTISDSLKGEEKARVEAELDAARRRWAKEEAGRKG